MPLVDVHTHLNDPAFAGDLEQVLARASAAGVSRMVVAGYDLPSSQAAVGLAANNEAVWATVGVSPHDASSWRGESAARLECLARSAKVVGIGEIGLDYHYDLSPRPVQREVFRAQLELAVSLRLPVVVHNREAHADTLAELKAVRIREIGGVMHCFSGSLETALQMHALGLCLSFGGPLTFKNAARLREVVSKVPLDSLLTETDAPYLAPHPHRGRRNEPSMIALVLETLADIRGLDPEELSGVVWANAEKTFGFDTASRRP